MRTKQELRALLIRHLDSFLADMDDGPMDEEAERFFILALSDELRTIAYSEND